MHGEPWPIDFDTLKKGSVVTIERCEKILGIKASDEKYRTALLFLRDRIVKGMEARCCPVTVRTRKGALEILTDAQASAYNADRQRINIRSIKRAHKRLENVDVSQLSDDELKEHESRAMRSAFLKQGIKGAKKEFKLTSTVRKSPSIADGRKTEDS